MLPIIECMNETLPRSLLLLLSQLNKKPNINKQKRATRPTSKTKTGGFRSYESDGS